MLAMPAAHRRPSRLGRAQRRRPDHVARRVWLLTLTQSFNSMVGEMRIKSADRRDFCQIRRSAHLSSG
jgi:hypothetical protein